MNKKNKVIKTSREGNEGKNLIYEKSERSGKKNGKKRQRK